MSSEPKTPLGFCPHCEYPIDPGRCPECGAEVPLGLLDREPYQTRRRIATRRAVKLSILSALLVAVLVVCWRVDWWSLLPTSWLLEWQGNRNSRTSSELDHRRHAGQLSDDEVCRWFERTLVVGSLHPARDPYPARVPILVECDCYGGVARYLSQMQPHAVWVQSIARIDGIQSSDGGDGLYENTWFDGLRLAKRIAAPPEVLSPGRHELSLDITVTLGVIPPSDEREKMTPLHSWRFKRTTTIVLEDRPASEYVKATSDPSTANRVERSLRGWPWGQLWMANSQPWLRFQVNDPPIAIAGEVWVRPAEAAEFTKVGSLVACGTLAETYVNLEKVPGLKEAMYLDVRLVPSAETAVQCPGEDEYYNRVFDWPNLPLFRCDKLPLPQ